MGRIIYQGHIMRPKFILPAKVVHGNDNFLRVYMRKHNSQRDAEIQKNKMPQDETKMEREEEGGGGGGGGNYGYGYDWSR